MTFIDDDTSPEDLLILTRAIATSLSKDKTPDEINVLGNFIIDIGRKILTIASYEKSLSSKQQSNPTTTVEDDSTVE